MYYTITDTTSMLNANSVKELVIKGLLKEGFLSEEKALEFLENYSIVVAKKAWLGRTLDKLLGFDKDENKDVTMYKLVKIIH